MSQLLSGMLYAGAGVILGYCLRGRDKPPRLSFALGLFTEQVAPVAATGPARGFSHPICREVVGMAFTMTDTQQVNVTISGQDKRSNPATFAGTPEWTTDNTDVLALSPAPDGLSCIVSAVGPLGTGKVQCKAAYPNGNPIFGTLDVTITGGEALVIALTPGTPTDAPTA